MRFIFCFILLLGFGLISSAPSAMAGKKTVWDVFFGAKEPKQPGMDPSETLIAPFADEGTKDMGMFRGKPGDAVNLKYAHTSEGEIGRWLMKAASESLTIPAEAGPEALEKFRPYFSDKGFQQYKSFLNRNSIMKVIESGRYDINSYAAEIPLTLNTGAVEDRFRWLFEVPVMISYMDKTGFDYKTDKEAITQKIMLTVQVGRVDNADNYYNTVIESWSGKSVAIEE